MAKSKPYNPDNDPEVINAVAIADSLREAALLLTAVGSPLGEYEAYVEQGMLRHAWEELRDAATDHAVPLAFWSHMSKAADLMGAP